MLGAVAPIARRMGSGQVDAAAAYAATIVAWDSTGRRPIRWPGAGALSFGYLPAGANTAFVTRTITIKQFASSAGQRQPRREFPLCQ